MTPFIVKIAQDEIPQDVLQQAGAILRGGGVLLHPTETVYGLAARWDREDALHRIARIKQRPPNQPLTLMVARVEAILQLSGWEDGRLRRFLQAAFPAPLTVLLPRKRTLPILYWNQFPLLGFRLPAHRPSLQLVQAAGQPLVTTSANLSGQAPPKALPEVPDSLKDQVDLVLDGGPCLLQVPSTIIQIDPQRWSYQLVRRGALAAEEINRFFEQG